MSERTVRCTHCGKEARLSEITKSRLLNGGVTQWYLKCPKCQVETHVHYMTKLLETMQAEVQNALLRYQANQQSQRLWNRYFRLRANYNSVFDRVQQEQKNVDSA